MNEERLIHTNIRLFWSFTQFTNLCCKIKHTSKGTSSSFVHPPNGWRRSTGLLQPRSSTSWRLQSCIRSAWPLWTGFLSCKQNEFHLKSYYIPKCKIVYVLNFGTHKDQRRIMLTWNANTASAFIAANFFLSSFGVRRYLSRPSFHFIRSSVSISPPTNQSPES